MFKSTIYTKAPIFLQEILIFIRAAARKFLREGAKFKKILSELEKSQWYKGKQLESFEKKKLYEILEFAVEHVPRFKNIDGLCDTKTVDELIALFPFTTKDDVRLSLQEFLADVSQGLKINSATGGTTGTPLKLKSDLSSIIFENAHIWRQLLWTGYLKGQRRVWLRADMVVPLVQKKPPFWRMNYADNMLMFSAYHMNLTTIEKYITKLESFNPVLIQAHPSTILYIARYLDFRGRSYTGESLLGIVTSSETLFIEDKHLLEKIFKCKVYNWYGSGERTVAIGTCEEGKYHIISDYGYLETFQLADGRLEIVGTGYGNKTMPLIRYKSGDTIVLSESEECRCGRGFPLVEKIEGRIGDYLLARDGSKVTILNHIPKGVQGLVECQLVQTAIDKVTAKSVVDSLFDDRSVAKLKHNIKAYLGEDMNVYVEVVESIPRTNSGKFRQAICCVDESNHFVQ